MDKRVELSFTICISGAKCTKKSCLDNPKRIHYIKNIKSINEHLDRLGKSGKLGQYAKICHHYIADKCNADDACQYLHVEFPELIKVWNVYRSKYNIGSKHDLHDRFGQNLCTILTTHQIISDSEFFTDSDDASIRTLPSSPNPSVYDIDDQEYQKNNNADYARLMQENFELRKQIVELSSKLALVCNLSKAVEKTQPKPTSLADDVIDSATS